MKTAQATVFVLLGVVIVIIFVFAIFAMGWINDAQQTKEAQNIVDQALQDVPINSYVSDCLERVTTQGVQKIFLQGGNLYPQDFPTNKESAGFSSIETGKTVLLFNYSGRLVNVSYAVKPNEYCDITKSYQLAPSYPFPSSFLSSLIGISGVYSSMDNNQNCFPSRRESGFFGFNNLTMLCNWQGPNYDPEILQLADQSPETGSLIYTCDYRFYDFYSSKTGQKSIQKQLSDYVAQHLPFCTNFSEFNSRLGGKAVIINNPSVELRYSQDGIIADAEYSFKVDMDGKPKQVFHSFSAKSEIPVQNIYSCAYELAKKESQDVFFNKTLSFGTLPGCEGYSYREYRNACPGCSGAEFDDIIQIKDNNAIIEGEPLTFLMAIKNRRPALEYIHDPTIQLFAHLSDIQAIQNQTITIPAQGFDPDELSLSYNYSGWREDYVEYFNASCCIESGLGNINCTVNITQCMVKNYLVKPKNWTNSSDFILTKKNASYKTTTIDAGLHFVNISVWDRQNLLDYQIIKILVFDLPVAVINTSNNYSDIPDNYASIEDPFFLYANSSRKSTLLVQQNISEFLWTDFIEPFFINTTRPDTIIPAGIFSINGSSPAAIVIKNFTKNISRNISLVVGQPSKLGMLYSFPSQKEVNVLQCIPHRSDSASWPYNQEQGNYIPTEDPFQADHACCYSSEENFGTIKDSSNNCFEYTEYGSNYAFTKTFFVTIPAIFAPGSDPSSALNYERANDIFKRIFTRNCSGTRGNTCTGPANDYREIVQQCDGYQSGLEESCSGPNTDQTVFNASKVFCIGYSNGDSFEKIFGLPKAGTANPADGICDSRKRCASGNGSSGGQFEWAAPEGVEKFPFKCSAQCSNGNCTYPEDSSCVCWSQLDDAGASVCDASPECNSQLPGSTADSQGQKPEKGCTNTCQYLSCNPYTFNPQTLSCYTKETTNSDSQCDDGYFRDSSDGPQTGKCIAETENSNKEDLGTEKDSECEFVLGASQQCDEKQPNSGICSNGRLDGFCSNFCQYSAQTTKTCSFTYCGADYECEGVVPNTCHPSANGKMCNTNCKYVNSPSC